MILSSEDIKEYIEDGRIKVKPELKKGQIGQASIDLTLDDVFWRFRRRYIGGNIVDLKQVGFKEATEKLKSKSIELRSQEMILGRTVEKLTLPSDLMGRLEGRSRYARMGLAVHITSSLVQPGSSNRQVLEIVNMAPFPIRIHAGMRISQVVFHKLESKTKKPYAKFGKAAVDQ